MAVDYIPEGYHTVTPYLMVTGAATLLAFLKTAFDATEKVRIGDSVLMLAEAPEESKRMPATLYVYVKSPQRSFTATATARSSIRRAIAGGSPRTWKTCHQTSWRVGPKRR